MPIHSSAVINSKANIDPTASIGPNCIIEKSAVIGKNVTIWQNVYIGPYTSIGDNTEIHMGAVIGHTPQDFSFKKDCVSYLKIGKNNIIREYANIHRASKEGGTTSVGDDNFLMGFTHIAHDCIIGNNIIMGNGTIVAGHATIEDKAVISGNCAIHQFARVGKLAMIAGITRVNKDVPPYMLCKGDSEIWSINLIGLRRSGIPLTSIRTIKDAFRILYLSGLNVSNAIVQLEDLRSTKEVSEIIDFIKSSKRGISRYFKQEMAEEDEF